MAELELGKLTREHPREVWANEAQDFTPWLEEHINLLGDALGMDIEVTGREVAVGAFSLDLLGKVSGTDDIVIIENQLEQTDHRHLGQTLAYAAGLDAKIVVWVSPDIREEHRDAIRWLNEHTTDAVAFLAVELEVWRIGDSSPAPRFNVVARPSGFQRELVRGTTAAPSERGSACQKFFADLVRRVHEAHPGFTNRNADNVRYDNWISFATGRSGFTIEAVFMGGRFCVGININTGARSRNKQAFEQLHAEREDVEHQLGEALEWERLDGRVQSRMRVYRDGGVESPEVVLDEHKQWAVDLLPKFRHAFARRIAALDLDAPSESLDEDGA